MRFLRASNQTQFQPKPAAQTASAAIVQQQQTQTAVKNVTQSQTLR